MTGEPIDEGMGYEIGHGKPPLHTRFKKGQSGNPKGRPRASDCATLDLQAILNEPVPVTKDGVTRTMSPKEAELRVYLEKAVNKKDFNAIKYLIEQFEKYGAIKPDVVQRGGVLHLPNTMPWPLPLLMMERYGEPPWTQAQKAAVRAEYIESRSDEDRIKDERIGYEDL